MIKYFSFNCPECQQSIRVRLQNTELTHTQCPRCYTHYLVTSVHESKEGTVYKQLQTMYTDD